MHIERIQVEEGFLSGLDLHLEPGLNVLIGPRGVGKTSIVEVVRYCLDASAASDEDGRIAEEHALSVLRGGQVTVTLRQDDARVVVSRGAGDERPSASAGYDRPTVLAQNEVEGIGLSHLGRLRLIDEFGPEGSDDDTGGKYRPKMQSQTAELLALSREIESLRGQVDAAASVDAELKEAAQQQEVLLRSVASADPEKARLATLQQAAARLAARGSVVGRSREALAAWRQSLEASRRVVPALEAWPGDTGDDGLAGARLALASGIKHLDAAFSSATTAERNLNELAATIDQESRSVADQSRTLRVGLETAQEGAGAIARRVAMLRERVAQRESLKLLLATRLVEYERVKSERRETFAQLDGFRLRRFERRNDIAEQLNSTLSPAITVEVYRGAADTNYIDTIASALKGSGIHYTELAPILAGKMSPRELVEAVEEGEVQRIAQAAQISAERAARVVEHLRAQGTSQLIAVRINDTVELALLDGRDYKKTDELSTGQRCTVVLPILLAHRGRPLVLDQPEDHLDNAFIADTLIRAVSTRKKTDQLIIATHNPNIPVLAEAELVVLLGSDGRRSFVRSAAPLLDPRSVAAISTVLEGGREAFERRAAYYGTLQSA
jgi:energy-coupling factor transporter ATP-binding protein EcfA2